MRQVVTREQLETLAATAPAPTVRPKPVRPTSSSPNGNGAHAAPRGDYSTLDVVAWFQAHGAYGRAMSGGKHAVECPWASLHSDQRRPEESDTCVWEADGGAWPQFKCLHAHCSERSIEDVLQEWTDSGIYCTEVMRPTSWPVMSKQVEDIVRQAPYGEAFTIEPLSKIATESPYFVATVNGKELRLTADELMNFNKFKFACMHTHHFVPSIPPIFIDSRKITGQAAWELAYLNPALSRMNVIHPVPFDSGFSGSIWAGVRVFLEGDGTRYSEDKSDVRKGKIVLWKGSLLFRGDRLRTWLNRNRVAFDAQKLWLAVRDHGGVSGTVWVGPGKNEVAWAWSIPVASLDVPEDAPRMDAEDPAEGNYGDPNAERPFPNAEKSLPGTT